MKTTRELAKEESHKQIVQSLQELLIKNYDADKGFRKAFQEVKDPKIKEFIKTQAFLHQRFTNQLDKLIHSLNETPLEEGSLAGKAHRFWMDIIKSIKIKDDKILFFECLRGEKAGLKEYEEKLKKYKYPKRIADIVKKQHLELKTAIQEAEIIEELA